MSHVEKMPKNMCGIELAGYSFTEASKDHSH